MSDSLRRYRAIRDALLQLYDIPYAVAPTSGALAGSMTVPAYTWEDLAILARADSFTLMVRVGG